ncbi:hypothetical protein GMLC_23590 [Geomonas limicola]|uniref:Uncharacterized protein n=1 Tax=Geomonas limicola TaxID=2740186 RepID=A0A6V8N8P1_9BACT|nr:ankyrin repeat domain-containing protein [Geomonas limicola]GFO68780.1 hypothetical protein GMLC_23590 [Geomonas limicola]
MKLSIRGASIIISFIVLISTVLPAHAKNLDKELMLAVHDNNLKKVESLVRQGANVNVKSGPPVDFTPLMYANSTEMVRLLLNKGADAKIKCGMDATPLLVARNVEIAEMLIARGAEVNAVTKDGQTPLLSAVQGNKTELVRFLLSKGAKADLKTSYRITPLMAATMNKNSTIIKLLKDAGARQ